MTECSSENGKLCTYRLDKTESALEDHIKEAGPVRDQVNTNKTLIDNIIDDVAELKSSVKMVDRKLWGIAAAIVISGIANFFAS